MQYAKPGRRGRNRTYNPQIRNLMLYPIELRAPVNFCKSIVNVFDLQSLSPTIASPVSSDHLI